MESALTAAAAALESAGRPKIKQAKVRRDSQGSLPKIAVSPYLDDYAREL
jgi:hypothetical protein